MNASYEYEVNNYEDAPETPYDGENINASYYNKGNNYEVAPDPPTNDININSNSYDDINGYEVTPDTPEKVEIMKQSTMMKKKYCNKNGEGNKS